MRRALLTLLTAAPLMGAIDPKDAAPPSEAVAICTSATAADDALPSPALAILKGYGGGGFAIATRVPEAQSYFDNGMQLAHAFAHKAATAAFRRAVQLDPLCAMCVWGEAWSRGPTINYGIKPKDAAALLALTQKAAVLAEGGSETEKAFIAALKTRYQAGPRGSSDMAFGRAMDALARAHPDDNEIAVIAADALMIAASTAPRHVGVARSRELLLGALGRDPNNTGAIHFYIHATEFDGVGTLALPYAVKLQALAPAASHLVHMPSHTYLWAGRFLMAEHANIDAVEIDKANAERLKVKDGVFGLVYHAHNVQFGMAAALLDNDAKGALFLAADEVAQESSVKPDDLYQQAVFGTALYGYGRYADVAAVEALHDPGARLPLDSAFRQYAIGEAAARAKDLSRLRRALSALEAAPRSFPAFEAAQRPVAVAALDVARLVLTGRLAMLEARYSAAEAAYRKAASIEDDHLGGFRDPPFWWYPVRRSLAAALLAEGRKPEAERELRQVLAWWPFDPVSLRLLADCAPPGDAEAAVHLRDAGANWVGDIGAVPISLM